MDLALPRFAGLGDGPQVHKPWKVSADSPASPDASCVDTSGGEDRVMLSLPCLNLDELSSSDDDTGGSVGLSDLSVTLLCGSDDVFTPINSDQVLSDVDLPPESVSHEKRQVIRIRDVSPDVQIVDVSQVGRAWDSRLTVSSGVSGRRMPLPLCTSSVDQMSTHPPAVTPIPATSTATIASREIDVTPGSSDHDPVQGLGPVTVPAVESVPAVKLFRRRCPDDQ